MRLSKQTKQEIVDAVIYHRFIPDAEALIKKRAAFADRVYKTLLSPKQRDTLTALPEGWVPYAERLIISFPDDHTDLYFNGRIWSGYFRKNENPYLLGGFPVNEVDPVSRRVPYRWKNSAAASFHSGHPLTKARVKLNKEQDELQKQINDAATNAKALIMSATTRKALLKRWPEIEAFVPDETPKETNTLPAIPMKTLNEQLGLPPKTAVH